MSQVKNGKAFEYALAIAFKEVTKASIQESDLSFQGAKSCYNSLSDSQREVLNLASIKAAYFLLLNDQKIKDTKTIALQKDSVGLKGDVRDIILEAPENLIGISAKHNHNAVKHSRLSSKMDFGKKWTGYPCSDLYFDNIKPVFDYLAELRDKKTLFRNVDGKEDRIYFPILKAFSEELKRLCLNYQDKFVELLFQYIVGFHDFYKVIINVKSKQKKVIIQSFNLNGTLGYGHKLTIPSKILSVEIKLESKNTLIIIFEDGWNMSFRIHSASSKVQNSLKFDIQFVKLPSQVISYQIPIV
ncbi:HaeIII family restriction endonuclease [Bartonella sp. CB60]|uniref:HaeIII family restriction endonuclease n=1 Tax=Bartonella sp. CB60 TaxID=3113619 RepID=UPI00300DF4D2